jgi:DMSO/TMAO reductase YedYZ molybdopterin-dependent catalytic subunit
VRRCHALSHVQRGLAVHDPTGLSALIPGGGWRYYTVTSGFPSVTPGAYRLRVAGLVANPLMLTLEDLAVRPRRTIVRDFQCVTGWRVPNVAWGGVPLAVLLSEARVQEAATAVQFRSFDGVYTESLTRGDDRWRADPA